MMCHECRIKNGYVGRDDGFHTAMLGICRVCGQQKSILPDRHWILKREAKNG